MLFHRIGALFISSITSLLYYGTTHTQSSPDKILVIHYESGAHDKELETITATVRTQFATYATHDKQIILFDIDDTALSCYPFFKEVTQKGHVWNEYLQSHSMDGYYEFLRSVQLPAFAPMLQLYQHFINLGYKVMFLTARKDHAYDVTLRNLHAVGYTNFERLIMLTEKDYNVSGAKFKEQTRIQLFEEGYEIVCTLDDANGNLQGSHVGYAVKIPNYLLEPLN